MVRFDKFGPAASWGGFRLMFVRLMKSGQVAYKFGSDHTLYYIKLKGFWIGCWLPVMILKVSQSTLFQIFHVPVREVPCHDIWIRQYTNTNTFSVKSAYHSQIQEAHSEASSLAIISTKTWKNLWNTPFMRKVRNFLWRALHNKLPFGENLFWRKMFV